MVGVLPDGGIGDSDTALRGVGSFEPAEAGVMDEADRGVAGVFAYGLGVDRESGLKLCPVSTLVVFTEPLHRGRLSTTDGGRVLLEAGTLTLLGVARTDKRAMLAFRGPCAGVGSEEWRRLAIWEGDLCLAILAAGVVGSRPRLDIITDDGGELPGVSCPLPIVDRSLDSMLETLSRSCWLPCLPDCRSSTVASTSRICSFKSSHFDWIS